MMNIRNVLVGLSAAFAFSAQPAFPASSDYKYSDFLTGPACTADGKASGLTVLLGLKTSDMASKSESSVAGAVSAHISSFWKATARSYDSAKVTPKGRGGSLDSKVSGDIIELIEEEVAPKIKKETGVNVSVSGILAQAPVTSAECAAQARVGDKDKVSLAPK